MDEKYNEALDLYQAGEYEKAIKAMAQSKAVAPEVYQQFVQQCRNLMGQTVPTPAANPDAGSQIIQLKKKQILIGGGMAAFGLLCVLVNLAGIRIIPDFDNYFLDVVLRNLFSAAYITLLILGSAICLSWVLPKRASAPDIVNHRRLKCGLVMLGIGIFGQLIWSACGESLFYFFDSEPARAAVGIFLAFTSAPLLLTGFILVVMALKKQLN